MLKKTTPKKRACPHTATAALAYRLTLLHYDSRRPLRGFSFLDKATKHSVRSEEQTEITAAHFGTMKEALNMLHGRDTNTDALM